MHTPTTIGLSVLVHGVALGKKSKRRFTRFVSAAAAAVVRMMRPYRNCVPRLLFAHALGSCPIMVNDCTGGGGHTTAQCSLPAVCVYLCEKWGETSVFYGVRGMLLSSVLYDFVVGLHLPIINYIAIRFLYCPWDGSD